MNILTPSKLQNYIKDYDYEITLEQSKEILNRLDNIYGEFTDVEIQEVTEDVIRR